jgi:hypothetical protein
MTAINTDEWFPGFTDAPSIGPVKILFDKRTGNLMVFATDVSGEPYGYAVVRDDPLSDVAESFKALAEYIADRNAKAEPGDLWRRGYRRHKPFGDEPAGMHCWFSHSGHFDGWTWVSVAEPPADSHGFRLYRKD